MKDMAANFLIGITSGLVTTFLVLTIRSSWIRIIVPWFEDKVYKDARIEGTWYGSDSQKPSKLQYVVAIERTGHAVRGIMTATAGGDKGRSWRFDGTFRNLILTANYGSTSPSRLDRGSLTLMLVHDGELLRGKLAFYANQLHGIAESDIVFGRNAAEFVDEQRAKPDLASVGSASHPDRQNALGRSKLPEPPEPAGQLQPAASPRTDGGPSAPPK